MFLCRYSQNYASMILAKGKHNWHNSYFELTSSPQPQQKVEKYMSSKTTKRAKIQSPNENGSGFIWAIIAVVLVAVAVIAYVIISGNKSQEEKFAETYNETTAFNNKVDGSAVQLVSDKADKAKTVDIYEDFSCHYCADLAKDTDADMKKLIEDGKVKVNIRTMNFLDKGEIGHSNKAGTAAYTIAKDDSAQVYWNFRTMLMTEQQNIWGKKELKDFADMAKILGAKDETVKKIADGTYSDEFKKIADDNAKKLEKDGDGQVSSPRVFIDGKEIKENTTWPSQIK